MARKTTKGFGSGARFRSRDQGSLTALEGVFIGLVLVSSVAILSGVDTRPASSPGNRAQFEETVNDILAGLEFLPTADRYSSQMEKAIGQAILGNVDPLNSILKRAVPKGTECRLWLDNGLERRLLAGTPERTSRESVSASRLYHPEWAYAFVVPSFEYLLVDQPLELQGYGVAQGALVKEAGIPLQVTVHTSGGIYDAGAVTSVRTGPTVTVRMLNEAGNKGFSYRDSLPLGYPVVPYTGNSDWTFVVEVTGATLPKGTRLTVHFPDLFQEMSATNTSQTGWSNTVVDTLNHTVTAELASPLTGTSLNLTVHAAPQVGVSGLEPLYRVSAVLSNGTVDESHFLLRLPVGALHYANPLVTGPYLSVPKPLTPGSTSTWGLTFPNPSVTGLGSIRVTKVVVSASDGSGLFATAVAEAGTPGTWQPVDGSSIEWTGDETIEANGILDLQVRVTTTTSLSPNEPAIQFPVEFGKIGTKVVSQQQRQPYIYRLAVPSNDQKYGPGYEVPTLTNEVIEGYIPLGVPLGEASAGVDWIHRAMQMEGNATYSVTSFSALTPTIVEAMRVGLMRSHINLSKTQAHIGDVVQVEVDFGGLYEQTVGHLGPLGTTPPPWEVAFFLLDPAQPFETRENWRASYRGYFGNSLQLYASTEYKDWNPTKGDRKEVQKYQSLRQHGQSESWGEDPAPSQPTSQKPATWPVSADVRSGSRAVFNLTVPTVSFFGPHPLIAEANFILTDLAGNKLVQTARILAVLDVLPDGGQSETALYWVSLECWLPDWQ